MLYDLWHDMQLYRRLLGVQIRGQLQYKAHLAIEIITLCVLTLLEFMAVILYFARFKTLLGWQMGEVALVTAIVAIGYSLGELIATGFDAFSSVIRNGEFDRVLLRPASVFVQIAGSEFRLRRFGRIAQGCFLLMLSLHFLPWLHWSAIKILVLGLAIVSCALVFMAIFMLGATICFWTIETTELTNILSDGGREMMSYPITIYHPNLQKFFLFVVPIAFGSFVPACYILNRPLPFALPDVLVFFSPVIALAFAILSAAIWHIGVRHYQSTGS